MAIVNNTLGGTRSDRSNLVFQHLLIQLIAHFAHLPRLFFAQQVARTTNIQVLARQREPGPQTVKTAQHPQAFLRSIGQFLARLGRQIGVSAGFGAANAAPDLVKLA